MLRAGATFATNEEGRITVKPSTLKEHLDRECVEVDVDRQGKVTEVRVSFDVFRKTLGEKKGELKTKTE